jgi:hypothetical protein
VTDAELLAEVRAAVADWERACARRIAAIQAAKAGASRATTVDDIARAAKMLDRAGVYKLLSRHPAALNTQQHSA